MHGIHGGLVAVIIITVTYSTTKVVREWRVKGRQGVHRETVVELVERVIFTVLELL